MTSLPLSFSAPVHWLGVLVLTAVLASPRLGLFVLQWYGLDDPAREADPSETWLKLHHARTTRCAQVAVGLIASALALVVSGGAALSKDKPIQFWNLTGQTVTHLSIAAAGTQAFGRDQCRNDRDGTVDYDERLQITSIGPGRYDLLLDLKKGRHCRIKDVEIQQGEVCSVEEKDLCDCTQ